jgi:hypothetical protein
MVTLGDTEVLLYVRNTTDNEHNYLNKSRRIVTTLHTFPVAVKSRCPVLYSFYLLLILFSSYPSGTDFYGMLIKYVSKYSDQVTFCTWSF